MQRPRLFLLYSHQSAGRIAHRRLFAAVVRQQSVQERYLGQQLAVVLRARSDHAAISFRVHRGFARLSLAFRALFFESSPNGSNACLCFFRHEFGEPINLVVLKLGLSQNRDRVVNRATARDFLERLLR